MDEIGQAQHAILELLSGLQVKDVICIDDIYDFDNLEDSIDVVIAWFTVGLETGKKNECGAIVGDPNFFDIEDNEIWIRRLRERWLQLDNTARGIIITRLAVLQDIDFDTMRDKKAASLLRSLIPNDRLKELSPSKWSEQSKTIISSARETEGLLCLFDYDLAGARGYNDRSGIHLLEQAIAIQEGRPVIFGVLTHKVKEGEELDKCDEFANANGLRRESFLVLSKSRLDDPLRFAHGLKMISINHERDRLTTLVRAINDKATQDANSGLMQLDVYNFDHMVLRSSEKEGVWEAETLFRLFEILKKNAFQEEIVKEENRLQLEGPIKKIRSIREIKTLDGHDTPPNQRLELRSKELLDSETFVNRAHLPLELGDIFEIKGQYYILLAQPCDLIIRVQDDGQCKRNAYSVILAKIKFPDNPKDLDTVFNYLINYFHPTTFKSAAVKFRDTYHIAPEVLDLAVYNDDGWCRFPPTGQFQFLNNSWQSHLENITKYFTDCLTRKDEILSGITGLGDQNSNFLISSISLKITRSNLLIPMNLDKGKLELNIHRVGRYRQPGATRLLNHYMAYLTRDAVEHDFAA